MYACICHAVTVDTIAQAVDAGADTIEAVGDATRAGTSCRCCHEHLDDIIDERVRLLPIVKLAVA